jgi:hypothetical protein
VKKGNIGHSLFGRKAFFLRNEPSHMPGTGIKNCKSPISFNFCHFANQDNNLGKGLLLADKRGAVAFKNQ